MSKKRYILGVFMLLLTAGVLSGYFLRSQRGTRNVILISIDTCRADYLGCYGFDGPITPRIDEIAEEGILFKKARTPVPLTLPAHCSLLTGTYPPYHQVHDNYKYKLDESNITLAEILQEHSFTTGAVISSYVLDRQYGTNQGFEGYYDQFEPVDGSNKAPERRGEEVSRLAGGFLETNQDGPFFLFLHYFDPHTDYEPPEPFASRYEDDLYAGEIAYIDQCIGRVTDKLKKLDLYDSTLIIIVGDHGESLGEHGESEHGYFIYQSTIHVPFIIKAPNMTKPKEVDQTVSLVDVAPTVLGYLDIPIPDHIQGNDLSGHSQDQSPSSSAREVYTESLTPTIFGCNPLLGVVSDRWSYINTNASELYDLEEDRGELKNLAGQEVQRVRLINTHLQEMVGQLVGVESAGGHLELDAESRRRLESLGYIGGIAVTDILTIDASKSDAKEMLRCYEYTQKAVRLKADKKYAEAEVICKQITAQWPKVAGVYSLLMRIAFETNRPAEVIKQGRQYFAMNPESDPTNTQGDKTLQNNNLAYFYDLMAQSAAKVAKYDMAVEYYEKYLQLKSDSPVPEDVYHNLALSCFRQGQHDRAFKIWGELLGQNPNSAEIYESMGIAYYEAGELEQAEVHLSRALQLKPNLTEARRHLNNIVGMKQLNQSIAQYLERLRRQPDDPATHGKLAYAFFQKGDYDMAIEHWRESIRIKPDWPEPYHNLAGLLATTKDQKLRNPAEAVRLAERAGELTQFKNADVLATLSIAYDAADKYNEAMEAAEKGLQLAVTNGNKTLAAKFRQIMQSLRPKRDGRN